MTTTTTNPAIALHHLTKEFGAGETKTVALADIDLELPYGELVLLEQQDRALWNGVNITGEFEIAKEIEECPLKKRPAVIACQ